MPSRAADAHKWRSAVWVIAGSGGMRGAANLATRAAQRSGAGMVRLSSPGFGPDAGTPTEAVGVSLPAVSWAAEALAQSERFHALVVGPGLGRADGTGENVRELVEKLTVPVVIDGDGLFALAWSANGAAAILRNRQAPTVLTPHDGEFALLRGQRVGADRIGAARRLADECGCVVLLKGAATVVAEPGGPAYVITAGDARLATAGTGDVLAGICGALLAQQVRPAEAAAAAAWLHGQAARRGPSVGLVAGDIPDLLPLVLSEL
jgi:NAD(P)H-hydrate epimerase